VSALIRRGSLVSNANVGIFVGIATCQRSRYQHANGYRDQKFQTVC